jgi:putative transposase
MAESLRFTGQILSARVSQRAKWWFVSMAVELADPRPLNTNPPAGLEVGVLRLGTLSDGRQFENQKPLRNLLKPVRRLHRKLSRQQTGSQNYEKTRLKLALLYYRIQCIRDDIWHRMTTEMARPAGLVGVEHLSIKGMRHNRHLALTLPDAALGRLLNFLETKVLAAGGVLVKVDRFFPSSKVCCGCGWKHETLPLADRTFGCGNPACGLRMDRDRNAAINILNEAVRLYRLSSPSR